MFRQLFHWAPADRYDAIRAEGLQPNKPNTVASGTLHYVCTGPDPRSAWYLSGAVTWCAEIEEWDLWHLSVSDHDELYVRPFHGLYAEEVKIHNPIPPDRLWWAGRRHTATVPSVISSDYLSEANP